MGLPSDAEDASAFEAPGFEADFSQPMARSNAAAAGNHSPPPQPASHSLEASHGPFDVDAAAAQAAAAEKAAQLSRQGSVPPPPELPPRPRTLGVDEEVVHQLMEEVITGSTDVQEVASEQIRCRI